MARDDFKKSVKDDLAKRVGYMCSNPDCAAMTSGPRRGASGAVVLGMACHIYAASPGGPRYKTAMTIAERTHSDNGIWLCRNCGTRVDSDAEGFPAELLMRWRIAAEAAADHQLSRPAVPFDGKSNQLSALMKAIAGENSIQQFNSMNIAMADSLNKLDERLLVSTRFDSVEGAAIHISAKQPATFNLNWPIRHASEIKNKLRDLHDHGRTAELSLDGAVVDGSALMKYLFSSHGDPGTLEISKPPTPLTINLMEELTNGSGENLLLSLECEAVVGNVSTTIIKKFWKDIVKLELKVFADYERKINVTFDFNLDEWVGMDIRSLPYLEKITHLRDAISGGKTIRFSIENEGRALLKTKQYKYSKKPNADPFVVALQYLKNCSRLAELLNVSILFPKNYSFDLQLSHEVSNALDLMEGRRKISKNKFKFLMTYPADLHVAQQLSVGKSPIIKCSGYPLGEKLIIFDREVLLPPHELVIAGCVITKSDKVDLDGDLGLSLEWSPKNNFSYIVRMLPIDQWRESRASWGENTSVFSIGE
ncbi:MULTISPECIES: hypothetical protein [unclassified Acidovorax]|uniref:hypothetical protein n=1 Tax=unclassified Acidovorax TaxID=2684926 RepID=UPI001C45B248|nr:MULTISPECIES: hypothetical protein [unclassified Acidovorax]MBV7426770.1 hypothetical protein [Acidovorax sp. sif0732]MBV7447895.1 hypothetical protein [Acidovorax sp. sif0715]